MHNEAEDFQFSKFNVSERLSFVLSNYLVRLNFSLPQLTKEAEKAGA